VDLVIVRGGGDIASGVVYRLYKSGYKIIVLEIAKPTSIRRKVSFSEAIYNKRVNIEGINGVLATEIHEISKIIEEGSIPIYIDEKGVAIEGFKPLAVVDSILAKVNLGTHREMAPITIGIGPGFEAGCDVDLVIESKRGHHLGKVIYEGKAEEDTGIPSETNGYRNERVLRSPADGVVKVFFEIGDYIKEGEKVCEVGNIEVTAQITGILRGMIKEGLTVYKGLKIGDIDPRGIKEYAFTISDKARAIGGGVLEGIRYLSSRL